MLTEKDIDQQYIYESAYFIFYAVLVRLGANVQ